MSKLNEIIVSQLPTQSKVKPCTAYLLDNSDGTHDRYVSDEDGNISIQLGGGIIEVTYAELVNLKNTSSLVKGQNYLLTDYMTTYEQPNTGVMKSSGVSEPLLLTAVREEQVCNVCRSTLYPRDIVY